MKFEPYIQWIRQHIDCEVYFIHDERVMNGFVEYRNQGHAIYILGNESEMEVPLFLDILSHEAGHVLYNRRKMAEGLQYAQLVAKTEAKLTGIHSLFEKGIISNEEYDRFYAAIEEEWVSNQEKKWILDQLNSVAVG
jgi:hypothetical protein